MKASAKGGAIGLKRGSVSGADAESAAGVKGKKSVKRGARNRRVEYIGFDEDWVPVRRHKDDEEHPVEEDENTTVGS